VRRTWRALEAGDSEVRIISPQRRVVTEIPGSVLIRVKIAGPMAPLV